MPELPEVQTVATRLDRSLRGTVVDQVELVRPDVVKHGPRDLAARLCGRVVRGIARHGKRILWRFEPDVELNVHLGMTGNLYLAVRGDPMEKHTHLVVRFQDRDVEVRYRDPRRFGGVWLSGPGFRGGRFSVPLGPDALAIRLPVFRRALRRSRQVKALLLDQRVVAGLGNIYVDEALHRSRIHPLSRASDLTDRQVERLLRNIRRVLRDAISAGGSSLRDYRTADGTRGWFQVRHRVYGRQGEPCRRCGTPVQRLVTASRTTHLCPRCQPAPRSRRRASAR